MVSVLRVDKQSLTPHPHPSTLPPAPEQLVLEPSPMVSMDARAKVFVLCVVLKSKPRPQKHFGAPSSVLLTTPDDPSCSPTYTLRSCNNALQTSSTNQETTPCLLLWLQEVLPFSALQWYFCVCTALVFALALEKITKPPVSYNLRRLKTDLYE